MSLVRQDNIVLLKLLNGNGLMVDGGMIGTYEKKPIGVLTWILNADESPLVGKTYIWLDDQAWDDLNMCKLV